MADTLGTLKTAYDLTKDLVNLADTTARQGKIAELQRQILDAQESALAANQERTALVDAVGDLKKEVARLEAWEAEKERYELIDLYRGLFAFVPKMGMERGEPPHALCANCYHRRIQSILQSSGHTTVHDRTWDCPFCKTKVKNQFSDMGALIKKSREAKPA